MISAASTFKDSGNSFRVLVSLTWPFGLFDFEVDLWLSNLAPCSVILDACRKGRISRQTFDKRYRAELNLRLDALRSVELLESMHTDVVLIWGRIPCDVACYCSILLNLLKDTSIDADDAEQSEVRPGLRQAEAEQWALARMAEASIPPLFPLRHGREENRVAEGAEPSGGAAA